MLLPTSNAALRRLLDQWFDSHGIHPRVLAEFQDAAQMKTFGEHGLGIFCAPTVVAEEIERQYDVVALGEADGIREKFYAVSIERKVRNPAVAATSNEPRVANAAARSPCAMASA